MYAVPTVATFCMRVEGTHGGLIVWDQIVDSGLGADLLGVGEEDHRLPFLARSHFRRYSGVKVSQAPFRHPRHGHAGWGGSRVDRHGGPLDC